MAATPIFLWLIPVLVFSWHTSYAESAPGRTTVPWDSVMAHIQLIKNASMADSVKYQMIESLFARYQITAKDYQHFYEIFLKKPVEEQQEFIDRMRRILQEINQPPKSFQ